MTLPKTLSMAPPEVPNVLISFPSPHVLLITLNRPAQLNAIPSTQHAPLEALYRWYDAEPSLRCAVLTGSGRAFCAGADLKEWDSRNNSKNSSSSNGPSANPEAPHQTAVRWTPAGFGGMSNRPGKKPVVAAVNGLCLGGGMEMAINADMVIAAEGARFGLPEVTRGVVAIAGALPRLSRQVGRQRAAEMALVGEMYDAAKMEAWGLVNKIVPAGEDVVAEAVRVAGKIADNSPDAVIVSREGLRIGFEGVGPELGTEILSTGLYGRIDAGENMKEGVKSFMERRKAVWKDSKL